MNGSGKLLRNLRWTLNITNSVSTTRCYQSHSEMADAKQNLILYYSMRPCSVSGEQASARTNQNACKTRKCSCLLSVRQGVLDSDGFKVGSKQKNANDTKHHTDAKHLQQLLLQVLRQQQVLFRQCIRVASSSRRKVIPCR